MRLLEELRQVLFDTRVVSSNFAKNLIVHNHSVSFTMNRIKIHKQLATQTNSQKNQTFFPIPWASSYEKWRCFSVQVNIGETGNVKGICYLSCPHATIELHNWMPVQSGEIIDFFKVNKLVWHVVWEFLFWTLQCIILQIRNFDHSCLNKE